LNECPWWGDIHGMTTICRSTAFVLLAVGGAAGSARATDGPLLVAADVAPGVDVAPADIRQAVASELGTPVIGARESTAAAASDLLLVGLDTHELRMSLRAGAAPIVSRTIAVPPDRPGRLRSIGWLAGNLVRDQIGPIVATKDAPQPDVATAPTEPTALSTSNAVASSTTPAAVVSAAPASSPGAIPHSVWAITASGGPAVSIPAGRDGYLFVPAYAGATYRVAVQRQLSPESLLFGLALDVGPQGPTHYGGVAVFVGAGRYRRAWFLEGNGGLGAEVLDGVRKSWTETDSSTQGIGVVTNTSLTPMLGLYLQAEGIAGVRISRAFDLVGKLGAHVSSNTSSGSVGFLSTTMGVRLRLP
jgi:hypothetical protein